MPLRHESLVAWQRADDLFIRIHKLSLTFPRFERYELGSQSRRYPPKERAQFLRVSLSSLSELSYCIHAARRLEYITADLKKELELDVQGVRGPLKGWLQAGGRDAR